jgi:uncharacterized protein
MQQTPVLTGLLFYALGVLCASVVATYPVFVIVQTLGWESAEFAKVFELLMKLSALVGLWPLLKFTSSAEPANWGYSLRDVRPAAQLAWGACFGVATLLALSAALVMLGVRTVKPELPGMSGLAAIVASAVVSAVIIALLEETWFRGVLHGTLARAHGAVAAVLVTAPLYALVHFIRTDYRVDPGQLGWRSGWEAFGNSFHRFADPGIVDTLLALFTVGVLLGLVRIRSGNVLACIGIHAGWVAAIKITKRLTYDDPNAPLAFLTGSYDGVIGYGATIWFALILLGVWRYHVPGQRCIERSPHSET